ncbi:MAG: cell division protein ZapA [Hyphomonadaceae bacterium]|nr:cell division protein ZapA [Hyphomonadaceae bacterium]
MAKATIRVYGRSYTVACSPGQEQRLSELGAELDTRISRIATAVGDVGDDRLLLVAALSLLDELHAAMGGSQVQIEKMKTQAADALEQAAVRIEALVQRVETRLDGDGAS